MPEGMSEMSRFSKVSSIFGRDAFATMRYVTLLNVSEVRDISNDERKVPYMHQNYRLHINLIKLKVIITISIILKRLDKKYMLVWGTGDVLRD